MQSQISQYPQFTTDVICVFCLVWHDFAVQQHDHVGELPGAQLARQLLLVLGVDGGEAEADRLQLLDEVGPRGLRLAAGEAPVGVEHDEVRLPRGLGQHRVVVCLQVMLWLSFVS